MYEFLACRVYDYLATPVQTLSSQSTIADALKLFEQFDFNMLPVVDGGKLLGVVTKFDVLAKFAFTPKQVVPSYDELVSHPVSEIVTKTLCSVDPETPLTRVLQLMIDKRVRSAPVLDSNGNLVGVISRTDIMRALKACTSGQAV